MPRSAPSCSGTPCARPATPSSSTRKRAARRCCSSTGRWWWTAAPAAAAATTPWSRIQVPEGCPPTDPKLRPFVIIDPRAGHGAGIGGFKSRQPGRRGAAPRPPRLLRHLLPRPGAGPDHPRHHRGRGHLPRAASHELHADAPKPVVIGNCQGGWAVMMLGAAQPELTGALVLNGAPLSYWAGERGRNPMRYFGGLAGGSWPASLLADLGNGKFDGANLVLNFEALSPGNTWFRQILQPVRERRHRDAALPGVRALVGRLLPDEPRRDPLDRREPVHRRPLRARRDHAPAAAPPSTCAPSARRWWSSPRPATTSPRPARRCAGSPTSTATSRRSRRSARPSST